jgi:hypothetical protein
MERKEMKRNEWNVLVKMLEIEWEGGYIVLNLKSSGIDCRNFEKSPKIGRNVGVGKYSR